MMTFCIVRDDNTYVLPNRIYDFEFAKKTIRNERASTTTPRANVRFS